VGHVAYSLLIFDKSKYGMQLYRLVIPIMLFLIVNIGCSVNDSSAVLKYTENFVEMFNKVNDNFDNLNAKMENVDRQLRINHIIDSAVIDSCLTSVAQLESTLIRIEEQVKAINSFKNDDSLKLRTSDYIKTLRHELIPIYNEYFTNTVEEYVRRPISQKNNDELIQTNQHMIAIHKRMMSAIARKYRVSNTYLDFVNNWTKRHSGQLDLKY
jgi:hypothetical protein